MLRTEYHKRVGAEICIARRLQVVRLSAPLAWCACLRVAWRIRWLCISRLRLQAVCLSAPPGLVRPSARCLANTMALYKPSAFAGRRFLGLRPALSQWAGFVVFFCLYFVKKRKQRFDKWAFVCYNICTLVCLKFYSSRRKNYELHT